MRHFILCNLILTLSFPIAAQAPVAWQSNWGGGQNDQYSGVTLAHDGAYLVIGTTQSTDGDVSEPLGLSDIWVTKVNSQGMLLWERTLGGSAMDIGRDIVATDDGGCIVLGETESGDGSITNAFGGIDVWIARLSSNGELVWQASLGGSANDRARKVIRSAVGDYWICGTSSSSEIPDQHSSATDCYLARVSADGTSVSEHCFGGTGGDGGMAVSMTESGLIVICGWTGSDDGDVIGNTMEGGPNVWALAVDEDFNIQWQRIFEMEGSGQVYSMCKGNNDLFYVTGSTNSTSGDIEQTWGADDIWVVAIDTLGALISSSSFGGSADENSWHILSNGVDGVLVLGYTISNDGLVSQNNGGLDAWVLSLSSDLALNWQQSYGGTFDDAFLGGLRTPNGDLIAVGSSRSTDGDVSGNNGQADCWMAKLQPTALLVSENSDVTITRVMPNPAHDQLNITWSGELSHLNIHDPLGKLIYTNANLIGAQQLQLPVQAWAAGVYVIRSYGSNTSVSQRFIKR